MHWWVQTLNPNFFSVGTEQVVYSQNKCLSRFGDYVEKQMVCPLFLLLFTMYTSVINASVTHYVTYGTHFTSSSPSFQMMNSTYR